MLKGIYPRAIIDSVPFCILVDVITLVFDRISWQMVQIMLNPLYTE